MTGLQQTGPRENAGTAVGTALIESLQCRRELLAMRPLRFAVLCMGSATHDLPF